MPLGTILPFCFLEHLRGNSFSCTFEKYRENVRASQKVSISSLVKRVEDDAITKVPSNFSFRYSIVWANMGSGQEERHCGTSARGQTQVLLF